MKKWNQPRARLYALTAVTLTAASVIAIRAVTASDHQDTPLVELSPRYDVNDVYAFPAPGNSSHTVLVLGTSSPITPAQTPSFTFGTRDQELYQIKIDNTGDAREDLVFQITFTGKAGKQKVTLRGPVAPNSVGTMNTLVGGQQIKGSNSLQDHATTRSLSISKHSSGFFPIANRKQVLSPRSRRDHSRSARLDKPSITSAGSMTWQS